jgi:hypothetical protein
MRTGHALRYRQASARRDGARRRTDNSRRCGARLPWRQPVVTGSQLHLTLRDVHLRTHRQRHGRREPRRHARTDQAQRRNRHRAPPPALGGCRRVARPLATERTAELCSVAQGSPAAARTEDSQAARTHAWNQDERGRGHSVDQDARDPGRLLVSRRPDGQAAYIFVAGQRRADAARSHEIRAEIRGDGKAEDSERAAENNVRSQLTPTRRSWSRRCSTAE